MDEMPILLSRQNSLANSQSPSTSSNVPRKKSKSNEVIEEAVSPDVHCLIFGQIIVGILVLGAALILVSFQQSRSVRQEVSLHPPSVKQQTQLPNSCAKTCRIELVESIPQNLTFNESPIAMPTFEAWMKLIKEAKHSLSIAAYKSSLRGKHVFGSTSQKYSEQGEQVYEALLNAGLKRKLPVRMVENGPSKDKGDNEDGRSLQQLGALSRRTLNMQKIFGSGTMHTKFILADNKHFYLGSANLDWRSLNQKMEQGVLVTDCECLAQDLSSVFEMYWKAAEAKNASQLDLLLKEQSSVKFNEEKPLNLKFGGVNSNAYLATSPRYMNGQERSWDLDSIVNSLNSAKSFAYIHVMDYFPMFLYRQQQQFWPSIDNAIRAALMRGVHVKMICAALHYPEMGLRFLKSLQSINGAAGSVDIKIFKVPSPPGVQSVVKRDRRTHKKFLVTDYTVIIGTSNWSGDYFDDKSTGAAIVIKQNSSSSASVIHKMKRIFDRDWNSQYAHPVDLYFERCILHTVYSIRSNATTTNMVLPAFCELEKDLSLLVNRSNTI